MVRLVGSILDRGENVFAFQEGVFGEDLVYRGSRAKELKDVRDPQAIAANAGTSAAFAFFNGDPIHAIQVHGRQSL